MEAADAHLSKDPVLARLIAEQGGPLPLDYDPRNRPRDVYGALLRAITGQQLSVRAAEAIYGRLLARFGGRPPTPAELLADDPDELRTAAGLSHAKVAALRSLAERVLAGELALDRLTELDDEEVIRELVAVKGIGEWTAHMFLMFTLRRPDVLPTGDQGLRNATMRAYGLDAAPDRAAFLELAEPWRPYRTRASLYLWRSLRNEPLPAAVDGA
jgi:DNA-3-methyladenine glycosylase II